jgi:hypothetical protein
MELVSIETTRVVYLVRNTRPSGQLYFPEAAAKLIARYNFMKAPTAQELIGRPEYFGFGMGKFEDFGISELRIYRDGIIVESSSNSRLVDAFIDDFYTWLGEEFAVTNVAIPAPEKHYESELVVIAKKDLLGLARLAAEVTSQINNEIEAVYPEAVPFIPTTLAFEGDPTAHQKSRRKLSRFLIERRVGIAAEENAFFCQAPLPTDRHLALLEGLEGVAR